MSTNNEAQTGAAGAPSTDPEHEAGAGGPKRQRKSLEDQIAETQQQLSKLLEAKRDKDRAEREANSRKIGALLKSSKLDRFSSDAWASSVDEIRALLAKAQGSDPSASQD